MAEIASRKATNAPLLQVNSGSLTKDMLLITMVVMQLPF